jgi:hypothetical protein
VLGDSRTTRYVRRIANDVTIRVPSVSPVFWVAIASAVAMIIGAFGTWVRVLGFISVSGTDAGDGWIVVAAAVIGAAALWVGQSGIGWRQGLLSLTILAALAAAITAGYDLTQLRTVANGAGPAREILGGIVSAGWGIYVDLFASCALALAAAVFWFQLGRRPAAADRERPAEQASGST